MTEQEGFVQVTHQGGPIWLSVRAIESVHPSPVEPVPVVRGARIRMRSGMVYDVRESMDQVMGEVLGRRMFS